MRARNRNRSEYAREAINSLAPRCPLVRRKRPGQTDISQPVHSDLNRALPISDAELCAIEVLLGASLSALFSQHN